MDHKKVLKIDDIHTEYELVLAARNNDDSAFEKLYRFYLPSVIACVSSFQPPASEKDDLVQEGLIGFLNAIRTYDNRSSSFSTYASLCVKHSVITALRKYNRANRLVCSAELESEAILPDFSPEVLGREDDRQRYLKFIKILSDFERKTLSLYISGMSYSAMADKLGCSAKSIDNAITRIKSKIKKQKNNNIP